MLEAIVLGPPMPGMDAEGHNDWMAAELVADPESAINMMVTREYLGAQWILAHCARAFNAFRVGDAIRFLCDLPNIWYDTSAVNDLHSHYLLIKHENRKRVIFGSDNVVAGWARSKYITDGRARPCLPRQRDGRPALRLAGHSRSSTSS